jgi:hypothetical protein
MVGDPFKGRWANLKSLLFTTYMGRLAAEIYWISVGYHQVLLNLQAYCRLCDSPMAGIYNIC